MKTTNMKTIGLCAIALIVISCYSPRNPHRLPLPVEFNIGMAKNDFRQKNDRKSYDLIREDEHETIYYAKTDKWQRMYLFFINDTLRAADVQLQEPTLPKQVVEIRKVKVTE